MKLLKNIFFIILFMSIFIFSLIYMISKKGPVFSYDRQEGSYSAALLRKYDYLVSLKNKKKIIVIGGSGVAFGLDGDLLKKETGYDVVNFGLHAGMGQRIMLELSKVGINEGDIVILAFELDYLQKSKDYLDKIGIDLVLQGMDDRVSLYKYFYPKAYTQLFTYLPIYYDKYVRNFKREDLKEKTGIYNLATFDNRGYMIYPREKHLEKFGENQVHINLTEDIKLHKNFKRTIRNYKKFVEKKGAKLYFAMPPIVNLSVTNERTKEILETVPKEIEEQTGIPFISKRPLDYLFPPELMYDTTYHCNSLGEQLRTRLLINELKETGIVK